MIATAAEKITTHRPHIILVVTKNRGDGRRRCSFYADETVPTTGLEKEEEE
jgi:hypothetical protein